VQVSGNGSNALDFHIAFTIGELSKSDPSAHFHIISKDSGFDPLIDYLRKRGIFAQRSAMIGELLTLKKPNTEAVPDKLETIIQNLASMKASKPRRVKTLSNTINALFGKSLDAAEVANFLKALKKRGHISVDAENVTYHL
jgi:hypothetical protein